MLGFLRSITVNAHHRVPKVLLLAEMGITMRQQARLMSRLKIVHMFGLARQ